MKIDINKLSKIMSDLYDDITDSCCQSEVAIHEVDGVIFTLTAYSVKEASDREIEVNDKNRFINV
jgi:hypothetical protein